MKQVEAWEQVMDLVEKHYNGNTWKMLDWLDRKNPMLGGLSPRDMWKMNRCENLLKQVKLWISENRPKRSNDMKIDKKIILNAIAEYMGSEGCDCCRGRDHEKNRERIAKLLGVKKYKDGSGYDFSAYRHVVKKIPEAVIKSK